MEEKKLPEDHDLCELETQYKGIWAGLPEAAAMPRELEAVGGMLVEMTLGHGCGALEGPSEESGDYSLPCADHFDYEQRMLFIAGKLAIAWMCGTSQGRLPLMPFSTWLVASITEEFRGNLDEILRLARQLKAEGFLADADVKAWTRSPPFGGSAVWFLEIFWQRAAAAKIAAQRSSGSGKVES